MPALAAAAHHRARVESAKDPPKDPYRTYNTLSSRAKSQEIVFRVHSPMSASPLLWTGNISTSGFASPNANLGVLTPRSYAAVLWDDPPWDRFSAVMPRGRRAGGPFGPRPIPASSSTYRPPPPAASAPLPPPPPPQPPREDKLGFYLSHTMTDHIHCKTRQTCIPMPSDISERPGTPEDDHTPWISTSSDLDWCIWEISRRLLACPAGGAAGLGKISLAIIKYSTNGAGIAAPPPPPRSMRLPTLENFIDVDDPVAVVGDGVIPTLPTKSPKEGCYSGQELHLRPTSHLALALAAQRRDFSVTSRTTYEDAIEMARTSSEVLYYGRIFAESIERNLDWCRETAPFLLPPEYYRPVPPNSNEGTSRGTRRIDKYKATETLGSGLGGSFLRGAAVPLSTSDDVEQPTSEQQSENSKTRETTAPRGIEPSWITQLVWDPAVDDFRSAMFKVRRRRTELDTAGHREGPVNGSGPAHLHIR